MKFDVGQPSPLPRRMRFLVATPLQPTPLQPTPLLLEDLAHLRLVVEEGVRDRARGDGRVGAAGQAELDDFCAERGESVACRRDRPSAKPTAVPDPVVLIDELEQVIVLERDCILPSPERHIQHFAKLARADLTLPLQHC